MGASEMLKGHARLERIFWEQGVYCM